MENKRQNSFGLLERDWVFFYACVVLRLDLEIVAIIKVFIMSIVIIMMMMMMMMIKELCEYITLAFNFQKFSFEHFHANL